MRVVPGLEALPLGHIRAFFPHDLEVDGAGVVGDGGKINLAAAALDLGSKDVAPDRDLAAVAQIVEAAGVGGLELLAVEQLDRLVREGETFNRKVGRCLLGLELDNGAFSCRYCSNSSSVRALPESARRTTGRLPVRSWIISASTRGSSTLSRIWRPALTWTVMPSSPKVTGSDLSRKPLTGIPFSFNSSIIRRTASGVMFG